MTDAYPLQWPVGRPRTRRPEDSRFNTTQDKAQRELIWEIERLRGQHPVISTNLPLRRDGLPYARPARLDDVGVAVYFQYNKKEVCFACDRWSSVGDNIWAICKTIQALRGIERWGSGDMMAAAFTGFAALPAPNTDFRSILKLRQNATIGDAEQAYKNLAKEQHPDKPTGSHEAMARLGIAMAKARATLS